MFGGQFCSDPTSLDDDELRSHVLDLCRFKDAVARYEAELLAEAAARSFWVDDGARSLPIWVEQRAGVPRHKTRAAVDLGRALRAFPVLGASRLPEEKLRLAASCTPADTDQEHDLVDLANALPLADFADLTRALKAYRDHQGSEPPPEPAHSTLTLAPLLDGWMSLRAELSPDDASLVKAIVDAGVDRSLRARHDGDPTDEGRTTAELRARALVDAACQSMRQEPSDSSAPDRYRVALTITAGQVANHPGLCDAAFYRVVLGAKSEVLDIGRTCRQWSVAIRRAVTHRDGHCAFPGCDRPPSWCDIHHCHEWEAGGPTCIDNGVLLCRRHHTFIHTKRWTVRIEYNKPTFYQPDGRQFHIRQTHRGAEEADDRVPIAALAC